MVTKIFGNKFRDEWVQFPFEIDYIMKENPIEVET